MNSITYHHPAKLDHALNLSRNADAQPPATGLTYEGRLNIGPAILVAAALSTGCWALILGLGFRLFH